MKSALFILILFITQFGFTQNLSYRIIYDSITPQLDSGNYKLAKQIWLDTEKIWDMDPQEEYLFICSSLRFDDISFFKKRIKGLIKNSGFQFDRSDTLAENLYGHNLLFYDKQVISWLIDLSEKHFPKWRKKNPEAYKIRREIEILIIKDQYIRSNFGPSNFADSTCDNYEKFWNTVGKADFQNLAELTTLFIRNNGIPNHFDHGTSTIYLLGLIIWHNLKNPNNINNAWSIILPWVDKAYFEGKIGYDLYASYDKWLVEHTGYQYYGFEGDTPILDSENFENRKKKYNF